MLCFSFPSPLCQTQPLKFRYMLRLLRLGFSYTCASFSYFRGTFCLSLPPCSSLRRFWPLNPDNWPLCAYSSPRGWFVWFAWWPCEWFWDPEGVLTWLCPGTGPLDLGSIFASNSCTALYEGLVALNTDAFSLGDKIGTATCRWGHDAMHEIIVALSSRRSLGSWSFERVGGHYFRGDVWWW